MLYSTITKDNLKVSKLGFGTMRFPRNNGVTDQKLVDEMIKYAFDNGVNYFDTAYIYGGSEVALGKAIKQLNRNDFYIADKLPFWDTNKSEDLPRLFNESLQRLQIDYFDFYLLHNTDHPIIDKIEKFEAIEFALQMKKEGKIKYLGFSIHGEHDALIRMLDKYDFDFVQIQYNYMDLEDKPGQKGYNELVKRGIPIIIMEPLKGGILADLPDSITMPYRNLGGSNASYSFRWLAEQNNIKTVLSGMSTMEQLKENIEIFSELKPLSDAEHAAIQEVKANILKYQKVPCTACGYCMPCPFGVKIPEIFKAWNTSAMPVPQNNWVAGSNIDYDNAAKCTSCGACLSHCPQSIDIPNKIAQAMKK